MKVVNYNIMVRQAATTVRLITMVLLLMHCLETATAQDDSPATSILLNAERPMYAGRDYEVECRVPRWQDPPQISWWLDDVQIPEANTRQEILICDERNETVSILTLGPTTPDHNGKTLKCQVEDINGIQEKSLELLVFYPPTVAIYMDPVVKGDDIREGVNVTLKCDVKSNPPVWRVKWMFQDRLLRETDSSVPLNESLILNLNSINRTQGGTYSCVVSNALGDAESLPLQVIVNFLPVCPSEHPMIYPTPLGQVAELNCGGDAVPAAYEYRWIFARALNQDEEPTQFRQTGPDGEKLTTVEWKNGISRRNYRPRTKLDYGTFWCNAENALGLQVEPCVFYVFPPGRPVAPSNCSVLNQTAESFSVRCERTQDYGFRQRYHLQVFDGYTGRLKLNKTRKWPLFLVGGLKPNRPITMRIAAISPRGRSEWLTMNTFTQETPTNADTATTENPVTQEEVMDEEIEEM